MSVFSKEQLSQIVDNYYKTTDKNIRNNLITLLDHSINSWLSSANLLFGMHKTKAISLLMELRGALLCSKTFEDMLNVINRYGYVYESYVTLYNKTNELARLYPRVNFNSFITKLNTLNLESVIDVEVYTTYSYFITVTFNSINDLILYKGVEYTYVLEDLNRLQRDLDDAYYTHTTLTSVDKEVNVCISNIILRIDKMGENRNSILRYIIDVASNSVVVANRLLGENDNGYYRTIVFNSEVGDKLDSCVSMVKFRDTNVDNYYFNAITSLAVKLRAVVGDGYNDKTLRYNTNKEVASLVDYIKSLESYLWV